MLQFFKEDKLTVIRLLALISFFSAMSMSFDLWFSKRMFPMIPFLEGLYTPNVVIDYFLIIIFFTFFLLFVWKPIWKNSLPIIIIFVYWILLDQNRIQPFFFEIIFVVFALTMFTENRNVAKKCLFFIFIGTYFWSGLHKCNDLFFEKWLNGLNKRIPFVPYWMRLSFTYAVPFLESGFGILLVFVKTRKIGVWLITIMHFIILITFVKGNYGYIVMPLTLFNIFTLFFIFYNSNMKAKELFFLNNLKMNFIYLITIILPFSNFFGFYDHILAFSYFSGKPKYARIVFNNLSQKNELPPHINTFVREYNETYYLDLNEWSANAISVMVYPEMRVYLKINKYVKSHLKDKNIRLVFY